MIKPALQFIAAELTEYLIRHMPGSDVRPVVVNSIPDQLKKNQDPDPAVQKASAVLCILNVEEDNLSRSGAIGLSQANRQHSASSFHSYVYCLVAITEENYCLALDYLSTVLAFFRQHAVFDLNSSTVYNSGLKKIVSDTVSQTTEQISQVWQALGVSYMPSAVYRFRLTGEITTPEETTDIRRAIGN